METLKNCNIIVDIEAIEKIEGANQYYEIDLLLSDQSKCRIIFDFVWEIKSSIENAYIERSSKFLRDTLEESSILLIENSTSIISFEEQVSGTRPTDELKNYILFDKVDTIVEVLTIREPTIIPVETILNP